MALLHFGKIDYTIRNVCFSWIYFLSLERNLQYMRNTHTQVKKQASVARILFAGVFGIFFTSTNKILLDTKIKEYNTKLSTTPNTYDESRNDTNTTPAAPQLKNLNHNHPLSMVPQISEKSY